MKVTSLEFILMGSFILMSMSIHFTSISLEIFIDVNKINKQKSMKLYRDIYFSKYDTILHFEGNRY
jgi:hypothetical protein